jgi:hypothetical protein
MAITRLTISLAKAEYLLNYTTKLGAGGDKRKFWWDIMGFRSPEVLRAAILTEVTVAHLQPQREDSHGVRYLAIVSLAGPSGVIREIRTVWIARPEEEVARFVTAYPQRGSS